MALDKSSTSRKQQGHPVWLPQSSPLSYSALTYTLPYIAQYPLWAKILIVSGPAIMLYIPLFEFQGFVNYWVEHNFIVRLMLLIVYLVVIPGGALTVFVQRTTFNTDAIVHRSILGITTTRSYADVTYLHYDEGKVLTISYADGSDLKVWAATADPFKVMVLIEDQAKKPIPTEVIWRVAPPAP